MGTERTRTSSEKNAFGRGVGLAHEFGLAMVKERVTLAMLDRAGKDPIFRAKLGAMFRGETVEVTTTFDQLLSRETELTKQVCELTSTAYSGDSIVEQALRKGEAEWNGFTEHDRFVPAGLNRQSLLLAYRKAGLKLNSDEKSADCDGENLPTEVGIIRQDLTSMMTPTDLAGRPFYLSMEEQEKWAKAQGGDGLTSVEETLFLVLRKVLELSAAPWSAGWCRCRNSHSSDNSLNVRWHADNGLKVNFGNRGYYNWYEGALVRKFLALGV